MDRQVGLPLVLQEDGDVLVERVVGVVGVGQALRLAAVGVGPLEQRLGLARVELRQRVLVVAQVAGEALGDQSAGRGLAHDVVANDGRQLGLVDRQREGHAQVVR